jgi:hypothetical protein
LRDGHFRYWFRTDAGAKRGDLPLEGAYSVEGDTLTLHRDDILLGNQRIFHPIKGMDALWRPEAFQLWLSKGTINTYGIIVKVRIHQTTYPTSVYPYRQKFAMRCETSENFRNRPKQSLEPTAGRSAARLKDEL